MKFQQIPRAALVGVLAGLASTVFLYLLHAVTEYRLLHPHLIWGLPLAGFVMGWAYQRWREPQGLLILGSTLLTHLFGGSAGREGTAVQMGTWFAARLTRFFTLDEREQRHLIIAGASAGFGSAIGVPWAGMIFGMEVRKGGPMRWRATPECLIASLVGVGVTHLLEAPHTQFPALTIDSWGVPLFLRVAGAGLVFGLSARFFGELVRMIATVLQKHVAYAPLRPFLVGMVIAAGLILEGTQRYAGLGIPVILDAFAHPASWVDSAWKALFTALTVGSGFKGGEFIPLVYIGSTLGSAMGPLLSVDSSLLAAVGLAAVFAGASNTPLACTVMAIEIFGWSIAPLAAIGCFVSFLASGSHR